MENQAGTLYSPSPIRSSKKKKSFLVLMVSLLILIVIRFLNFSFIWQMTKLELKSNPLVEPKNYFFMGLSSYEQARQRLLKYSDTRTRSLAVVSYYTFLNPAVFLISNSGPNTFVELGRLAVLVESGLTWVKLLPQDVIEIQRGDTLQIKFFGTAILSFFLDSSGTAHSLDSKAQVMSGKSISYVDNLLESTRFLKIRFMVYFYLPLFLILWLAILYGKGFYLGFLYYFGLFLFFDFKKTLFVIPFFWLFEVLGIEISGWFSLLMGIGITLIFLILTAVGVLHWKNFKKSFWSLLWLLVFILLPVCLRF